MSLALGEGQLQDAHHEIARLNRELAVLSSSRLVERFCFVVPLHTLGVRNKDNSELSEAVRRTNEAKITLRV